MDYKQFEGHTSDEWLIDCTDEAINTYKNGMVIRTKDKKNIIAVVTHRLENWQEQEKNVLLIAAAPDLLKENQELKLELQKQKELNAELTNKFKELLGSDEFLEQFSTSAKEIESLIKKSSEI